MEVPLFYGVETMEIDICISIQIIYEIVSFRSAICSLCRAHTAHLSILIRF